ncbi:MAG: FapA family protein [Fibrobacterota bacterium]
MKKDWIKNVTLTFSDDSMEAQLRIRKGKDLAVPTVEEIREYVKNCGVNVGLVEETLPKIAAPSAVNGVETYGVARGIPAVQPEPGRIDFLINFDEKGKPQRLEDGTVDFKDIHLIIPVEAGAPLARKIPGKFGRAGRTVRGEPLRIPDIAPVSLPTGVNTRLSETDPNLLVAAKAGNAVRVGLYVNIYEEHLIRGDVDFSTGNVAYSGSIRVQGSVRMGFNIKAGGNLVVEGDIEGSQIECGGNLVVQGGILGKLTHVLRVQGNVEARYVNGCHLRAMGNILIQDECLNAKLESAGDIYLWKKGVMVGGEAYCFNKLDARILGAESGTYTDVYFGFDTLLASRLAEIKTEREGLAEKSGLIRKKIFTVLRTVLEGGQEPDETAQREMTRLKAALQQEYEGLRRRDQEEDDLARKKQAPRSAMVVIRDTVHAGVKLAATTTTHFIREKRQAAGAYMVNGADIVFAKGFQ